MYNLFVSANEHEWNGEPFEIEQSRCVSISEYTTLEIVDQYGDLDKYSFRELRSLPCIFAYETVCGIAPKFGVLRDIKRRASGILCIDYDIVSCERFLTAQELLSMRTTLDIGTMEMNRTHWAVKDVDLSSELDRINVVIPVSATPYRKKVDVTRHTFEAALSFPGEYRDYVESVANELEKQIGPDACFYDRFYEAQLARPKLDVILQRIYGEGCKLVVAFVCAEYNEKNWCGIEWQKIRERVATGDGSRIMYIRLGEGEVEGMSSLDGYVDAQTRSSAEIADLIIERLIGVNDRSRQ